MDRIDSQIVAQLQKNARIANTELADKVGLAPSSAWERVKRLSQAKTFTGFHAEVDPAALGIRLQAIVAIRIGRHDRERVDRFRREVLGIREVVALYHLAGRDDYLLHVVVRDAEHLRKVVLGSFTTRPEVAHVETHLVFEHVRKPVLPNYTEDADE